MVNFVIVSHSHKIAEGVVDLVSQMKAKECKVIAAGGVDDENNPIGTDAVKIMQAIEEAYSDDGVLVFVDLGSAILSAETALDLLDPKVSEKVTLCYAPLVEGAIAAVVAASSGDSVENILAEANSAAEVKLSFSA